ncbi:putative bifunctional diguanylate cyclase/phosphodiesterase [Streptomyces sp. NPDC058691]|uniref:putative bifunctional diguanylate cyclase/phosphodiesterase n=1 Tax=Streptomyces sp. NPDC058691 TaxID=3346601 RepID=UPI00364BB2A8
MTVTTEPGPEPEPADSLRRFAIIWSRAIYPATATSMTRGEFEEYLLPLAARLEAALHAQPFDARAGAEIGSALVAAHCTDPEALPRILGVVDAYLLLYSPLDPALPADEGRTRSARLQHWIAYGYAGALRERTRTEQEALSRAALAARTAVEQALHESEVRFRAIFQGASIGIGIADMEGRILDVNDALTAMFGGLERRILSRNVYDWVHPEDAPEVWEMQRGLNRGERDRYSVEKAYYRPDGTVLWTNLTVSLLRDHAGVPQYMLALMEDITEERLLSERLRYEATHDALTGLANRNLFFERLEQVLGGPEGSRVGVCYLDLDGFKDVNDSLGHAVGDRLLVAVAERLKACVTSADQLVARIGGDEFAALVVNPASRADVTGLADLILAALADPIRVDDRELAVRCSIGIVEGQAGKLGPAEVLRSADITMYRAKAAGGNRFELADPDSDARAITRHGLTNQLPIALERGEFFIEYQPLVRLADGSVRGAEALVRWCHPVHGVLGPDRFIALAESTGLIVPLGHWVLQQAAWQARDWQFPRSDGHPLRINVNLSPAQLSHRGLVPETLAVIKEAGLEPTALCLEVTESAFIGADEELLRPLREFADLGMAIALDDFGTGYSNLASLRRLPITTLKLDRSFTRGMQQHPADPVDVKIVEVVVDLAHTLGLSVTVEGVETGTQAEYLRALGCDTAQGWYYARPGPPDRLHSLSLVDATA